MDSRVFLDTSFVLARLFPTDRHHAKAVLLDEKIRKTPVSIITSRAVCMELGAALSKPELRALGTRVLEDMEQDPQVLIQPLAEPLYAQAFRLFSSRPDKGWSLADCMAFVIMQEQRIQSALTADIHFQQAGFASLLLETALH
jgi:predicted nucleic acid-binding protein